ncbi:MAG: GrpB family protein [Senegalia sp. (in: firmicutes)]|uniref:GrpB family protein n=1 Tax=Senegalia sp. (in: firmicutes) TaxID=1924098 RepID=UPI003F9778F6
MLGLPKGVVKLETYDPKWVLEYEREEDIIQNCIGNNIIDIQHVGSTSLEGLSAKPIIDIAIGVDSILEGYKCIEPFEQLGYVYKGEAGISGRLFFSKGDVHTTKHHVHVEKIDSINWLNQILFRDYLRIDDDVRDEYDKLKKKLSLEYANDREIYTLEKADFILNIIEQAKKYFSEKNL